jgi:uncharacterized protein (DUF736 family)
MNIGEMIRSENGGVNGYIAEAGFDFDGIFLEKVASDNPRAPLFNLMTKSPRGRDVRLGSIWERAAKETGKPTSAATSTPRSRASFPFACFVRASRITSGTSCGPRRSVGGKGGGQNFLPRTFAGMPWSRMPSSPTMIVTTSARAGLPVGKVEGRSARAGLMALACFRNLIA